MQPYMFKDVIREVCKGLRKKQFDQDNHKFEELYTMDIARTEHSYMFALQNGSWENKVSSYVVTYTAMWA